MSENRKIAIWIGFVLSASLMAASLTAFFLSVHYSRIYSQALGEICQKIIENQAEAEPAVLSALKEYRFQAKPLNSENVLLAYGYGSIDFLQPLETCSKLSAMAGFLLGGALFLSTFLLYHKRNVARIKKLTDYLEQAISGSGGNLFSVGEDDFSRLQDEIDKTVTELYQTKEAALKAKNNFAENLYNIAHQLKTPITAISLSVQMMEADLQGTHLEQIVRQIARQLSRLTHLEEALLLLSRIDAGTLSLERKEVDVFTVLMLAADNLQALFQKAEVSVDIPESYETRLYADLDWTMEAIMNLLKNCLEHTPKGGTVHCAYEQNPLYTQIRLWDTGCGFAKEDLPYLFQRFYRGRNEKSGGIGIGLALSKAIIESQNGTVAARNLPEGGACFEIHFYSH